jgi:hypothetical protein
VRSCTARSKRRTRYFKRETELPAITSTGTDVSSSTRFVVELSTRRVSEFLRAVHGTSRKPTSRSRASPRSR